MTMMVMKILRIFLLNKKTTRVIFKVKYDDLSSLKKLISKYQKDFNLRKIYAIQISRKPDFFNDKQVYQFLKELKKSNFVDMNRVDNISAILDTFQEFLFTLMVYGANIWIIFAFYYKFITITIYNPFNSFHIKIM